MYKKILAAVLISTISVAHAQTNPLSDLVGALGKLGEALKQPAAQQQQHEQDVVGGGENTDQIIRQLANTADRSLTTFNRCDYARMDKEYGVLLDQYKMAQYPSVSAASLISAQVLADCVLKQSGGMGEMNRIGELLALSALSGRKAGYDRSMEITIRGEQALTLLKLSPDRNRDLIALVESEVMPKIDKSSATASKRMSAFDVATRYQKNQMAFVREFDNKTLQVDGVIERIGGDGKWAMITLGGIPKHRDLKTHADSVSCHITNTAALDNAMSVAKGQKVSVRGIYTKKQFELGVTLYDCAVVM